MIFVIYVSYYSICGRIVFLICSQVSISVIMGYSIFGRQAGNGQFFEFYYIGIVLGVVVVIGKDICFLSNGVFYVRYVFSVWMVVIGRCVGV